MQTDLSTIDDPKELKSMAYDQIANREEAENNLRAINQRLLQILKPNDAMPKAAPSVTDADLGIEGSADQASEVE